MKIRKFTCPECGAPKVNAYKGPYVMCDYCGSLMGVDAEQWLIIENNNKRQSRFEELHHRIVAKSRKAIGEDSRESYKRAQQEYFNNYYNIFPEFIPPTIEKGEPYKQYLQLKAEWATDIQFDDQIKIRKKKSAYEHSIKNFHSPKEPHLDFFAALLKIVESYHSLIRLEIDLKTKLEKYNLFNQYVDPSIAYKMKMSIMLQPFFLQLSDTEIKHLVKKYSLDYDFSDVPSPDLIEVSCSHCQRSTKAVKGAIRSVCDYCLELNIITHAIHCSQCGSENTLPEKWRVMLHCNSCGSKLSVVRNV